MSQGADRKRAADLLGVEQTDTSDTAAASTPPRIVTLTGPAGIGKSHILRTIASDWAASDRPTRRIVGAQFDQHIPLGGVRQLLGASMLEPSTWSDGQAPSTENIELAAASELIAELDDLAGQNALVLIDDAHWLDETSRRIIEFALRRLDDRAPATLIAQRHGIPMVSFGERIEIGGMSREEFGDLLAARGSVRSPNNDADRSGGHGELDDAWKLTSGNPLAAIEWTVSGGGVHTVDVGATVAERINACTDIERNALCMLAVSRRGDQLATAWSSLHEDSATPTLAATIRSSSASDLVELDAPLRFRHPEYRDAASRCITGEQRGAVARSLATSTSDDDSAAWHLADATETADDEVARLLGDVARRSIDRGTPIEAARASERAAQLATDPALACDQLIAAGEAWWYACFPGETARVTVDGWHAPVDLPRRIRLKQLHRAAVGWRHNVMDTIRGYLDDAAVVDDADPDMAAGLRVIAFIEACLAGQPELGADIATTLANGVAASPAASASPIWAGVVSICRSFASILRGTVPTSGTGDLDEQLEADLATVAFFTTLEPAKLETSALNLLQLVGYGDMVLDRRDQAMTTLTGLRVEAHVRGATAITDFTEACLAELERRSGRWASALSRTMTDIEIDPKRTSAGKAWQLAIRARMFAAQGQPEVAALAQAALDEAEPVGMEFINAAANIALAVEALCNDEPFVATTILADLEAIAERGGALEPGALWFELDQLEALWRCDDAAGIRRVTSRLEAHGARTGRPWSLAVAALGGVLAGRGNAHDARDRAQELAAPFETARILLLIAESERGSDNQTVDITAVREQLARLGAGPFVQRCDHLLGSTTPTDADAAPTGILTELTPAELRVAVSVAAGRTNGEAAGELFLSARTVEAHLRAIFRKLDVRNRVELAAVVATADSNTS